ncbi:MAG: peptidoglycan-binding domain-containing protein [Candidatus Staskawiczbacteria bacterium]|jgi:hypothetical protein
MNKKLIALFISAGLLALPFAIFAQTAVTQGIPIASNPSQYGCINLSTNLKMGASSDPSVEIQVLSLQLALTNEGFAVASGEMGTYGQSTAVAVKAFQERYSQDILAPFGLTHGTGNVGTNTRLKLLALYGCMKSYTPNITASLSVTNMVLNQNGVSATFCNNGTDNLPTAPFRIRLNGINRDFEEPGADQAGACVTDTWLYSTWGLSFDPGSTFTAVALVDPNNVYKHGQLVYPVGGTSTLTVPSLTGVSMAVRSAILKSSGLQATFCNSGTQALTSFPVQITMNGNTQMVDVSGAYTPGSCPTVSYPYSTWGLTYTPGTTYSVVITIDPNNVDKDPDKFDNVASVIGTP